MNVYKITNSSNNFIYIGQTKHAIEYRFSQHVKDAFSKKCSTHLHRAIKKYGIKYFKIELVEIANTIEELNQKEAYWIKFYNSMEPFGYNMTSGGSGYIRSNENKIAIGNASRGRKHTKEVIKLFSKQRSGNKNVMYGKNHTSDAKKAISNARIGNYRGELNTNVKLNWQSIDSIRKEYSPRKMSSIKLSKKYGVHYSTILRIVKNKLWIK